MSAGSGGAALGARKIALNGRNPMYSTVGEQVSAGRYLAATLLAAGSERMSLTRDSRPYPIKPAFPRLPESPASACRSRRPSPAGIIGLRLPEPSASP